jgi:hypothetical protein
MKSNLCFIAVLILIVFAVYFFDGKLPDEESTEEEMTLLLPMTSGKWMRQGTVYTLELAHGWLVTLTGNKGGLCFVPKPSIVQE